MRDQQHCLPLYLTLTDKFGDNGPHLGRHSALR